MSDTATGYKSFSIEDMALKTDRDQGKVFLWQISIIVKTRKKTGRYFLMTSFLGDAVLSNSSK